MFSFKSIVLIAGVLAVAESSGVPVAAPLVAAAQVGYSHAVPQNVPPYASQISLVNRAVTPLAAPLAPAPYFAGPAPAPYFAGPAPAPYFAGPAPAPFFAGPAPAPYALPAPAPYAAPFPYAQYAPSAPLIRTAFGYAPTFVR